MSASGKICAGAPPLVHDVTDDLGGSILVNIPDSYGEAGLVKHIDSIHEKVKHPCNQCEYKATTQGHLKTHIGSVHKYLD